MDDEYNALSRLFEPHEASEPLEQSQQQPLAQEAAHPDAEAQAHGEVSESLHGQSCIVERLRPRNTRFKSPRVGPTFCSKTHAMCREAINMRSRRAEQDENRQNINGLEPAEDANVVFVSESLLTAQAARWRAFTYHFKVNCFSATSPIPHQTALTRRMRACKYCVPDSSTGQAPMIAARRSQHVRMGLDHLPVPMSLYSPSRDDCDDVDGERRTSSTSWTWIDETSVEMPPSKKIKLNFTTSCSSSDESGCSTPVSPIALVPSAHSGASEGAQPYQAAQIAPDHMESSTQDEVSADLPSYYLPEQVQPEEEPGHFSATNETNDSLNLTEQDDSLEAMLLSYDYYSACQTSLDPLLW